MCHPRTNRRHRPAICRYPSSNRRIQVIPFRPCGCATSFATCPHGKSRTLAPRGRTNQAHRAISCRFRPSPARFGDRCRQHDSRPSTLPTAFGAFGGIPAMPSDDGRSAPGRRERHARRHSGWRGRRAGFGHLRDRFKRPRPRVVNRICGDIESAPSPFRIASSLGGQSRGRMPECPRPETEIRA